MRPETKGKLILGGIVCVALVTTVGAVGSLNNLLDAHGEAARREYVRFQEQCRADGHTATDCAVLWANLRCQP